MEDCAFPQLEKSSAPRAVIPTSMDIPEAPLPLSRAVWTGAVLSKAVIEQEFDATFLVGKHIVKVVGTELTFRE